MDQTLEMGFPFYELSQKGDHLGIIYCPILDYRVVEGRATRGFLVQAGALGLSTRVLENVVRKVH